MEAKQMHATQYNTTTIAPQTTEGTTVGRYLLYPDRTGGRRAEGGLRTKGVYKRTLPDQPLVTIFTVCLNSEKTLEQAVLSVLGQTYKNIEYLIVDGGSPDSTMNIVRSYGDSIDYYVSEPDKGLYDAFNKSLSLASGDYVLVLNSDDWFAADAVESLIRARSYAGTDFVSGLSQYVDQDGAPIQVLRPMPFDASTRLRMPLRHGTMLVPTHIYNTVGPYDLSYRIIADFHLTIKIFEKGYSHYEVPRPLMYFRNTGISNTHKDKLFKERERLIWEQFPFLTPEESTLFGEISQLSPDRVASLAQKYAEQSEFIRTLRCYFEDQTRRKDAPRWQGKSIDWHALTRVQKRPKVSVILAVYKAETTLAICLDSILSQTLSDFEVICVNDASPDGSQSIVDEYVKRDPRVRSIINEKNIGLGPTRNHGIRHAKGDYIFHIDPDDTIPPDALRVLYEHAVAHGSDMVKGAFLHEQYLHGQLSGKAQCKSLNPGPEPIINTTLSQMPDLLKSTEGHWSYLYKVELARTVPYPTDLKMGQDSIFLVNALVRAKSVSVLSDVVYHYKSNVDSAMNTFTFRKYEDALEWRRRAWHILNDANLGKIGRRLLQAYWGESFFRGLGETCTPEQVRSFFKRFRDAFSEAGGQAFHERPPGFLSSLFPLILHGQGTTALALMRGEISVEGAEAACKKRPVALSRPEGMAADALRVATFCSMDHGGAGTGSQRRVEALRKHGVDTRIFSLVVKSQHSYVKRFIPHIPGVDVSRQEEVWRSVREKAILPARNIPGFCATELFSNPYSVVDFSDLTDVFESFDVIHFHWVVGMFDYERAGRILGDKPLVWTLADMNAFTGGCHYSEGCEGYKDECRNCPLLGGKSNLAHENWKIKKAAYDRLNNLHIICPSLWMAERVSQSSLLGDKPVHYIPNAFPTDRYSLTNKIVARRKLGLPMNKKLMLFGADSLQNFRKGGDLLTEALESFVSRSGEQSAEVVVFGNSSISLPLRVRSLGYISDDAKLALAYAAADVFLFPSREDNAPLTIGEALLCGTPVVSFPVGHASSLLTHKVTGYVADYLDVEDFARGIAWALGADAQTSLTRSLRSRIAAAKYHDPKKSVGRHIAVYSELMRKT